MTIRRLLIASLALAAMLFAQQPAAEHGIVSNLNEAKFGPIPGLPTCLTGAVEHGNPMSGAYVLVGKFEPGCSVPWHWHSASESLVFVNGAAHYQAKGDQAKTVSSGGYIYAMEKHPHQITCPAGCTIYVSSDAAFDIHYVDQAGNEISPEKALASVGEHPATIAQK